MGGANVWAESKTYNYTFKSGDFSTSKLTSTLNGVTWTLKVNQWQGSEGYSFDTQYGKGFKIGSSKSEYPKDATLSTSEIDGTITSIVINTSGNSKTTARLDVLVGGKAFGKQQALSDDAKDLSFTGSASGQIELKYSNSNKPIYIKTIAVTYETAPAKTLTYLAISGEPTKKIYDLGEALDPTGLVVTGTYDDNSTATITDGITWAMDPATLSLSDVACSVTATVGGITSPAYNVTGLTVNEAKVPSVIFYESFDKNDGTGGNDGEWSGNIATNDLNLDNSEWRILNGKGASKCAKIGSGSKGTATTPSIDLSAGDAVLAFKAGAWNGTNEKTSIIVSVDNGKLAYNGKVASEQTITLKKGEFSDYTMTISGGTSATKITFTAIEDKNNRFFLDEVMVSKVAAAGPTYTAQTLKLIAQDDESYYATFSSDKVTFFPIDQVIPYAITVANGKITEKSNMFESKVASTGSETISGYYIPANTGIMLYSTASNVNYYTVENYTVDDLAEDANMLMPSVAGGEFTAEASKVYYKLAYGDWTNKTQLGFYWGADNGGAFYVKAGTAYLAVPKAKAAGAKGFAFNGEATGIEGVNANVENAKAIYNLNGQRVASMAKPGLYIVNGKKVVRK